MTEPALLKTTDHKGHQGGSLLWLPLLALSFLFTSCTRQREEGTPRSGPEVKKEARSPGNGREAAEEGHYLLQARINPRAHSVEGTARFLVGPLSSNRLELFLNSTFEVKSIRIKNRPATHQWGDPGRKLPYVDAARLLVVTAPEGTKPSDEAEVVYSGSVPDPIAGVNVIRADLVELAMYAAWYPVHAAEKERRPFTYSLDAEVPDACRLASRGKRSHIRRRAGWRSERWRTSIKGSDIVLFASNDIKRISDRVGDTEISLSYRSMKDKDARQLLGHAVEGFKYFTRWLGKTAAHSLQIINSPRGGWGYSRPGFILMSEPRAMERLLAAEKIEPRFGLLKSQAHEIAHLWWSWLGDPSTSDDWINEALAEYSSAKDTRRRGGRGELQALLRSYLDSVRQANPPAGILETRSSDSYRGANWYHKGGLFFLCLERRVGAAAMNRLLSSFLRWRNTGKMTAERLLDIIKRYAGKQEKWVDVWLRTTALSPLEQCVGELEKEE